MADEWGNIGWTAQDSPSASNYDTGGIAPWKIPADVATVLVKAQYPSISGGRTRGFLQFKAMVTSLEHLPTGATLVSPKWSAALGVAGDVSVRIPASDAAVLNPVPFQYEVTVVVNYKIIDRFYCTLLTATPEIALIDIVPDPSPITLSPGGVVYGGSA